jgi:hypothetical protein
LRFKKVKVFKSELWNITIYAYLITVVLYALLSLFELGREVEYTYTWAVWILDNLRFIIMTVLWFYYGYYERERFSNE